MEFVNYPLARYLAHGEAIDAAIHRVMTGGRYVLGDQVLAFEDELARFTGVEFGIGVASGTDALRLALAAVGVERGDEVITVSHTAVATVAAIVQLGSIPVLVDIDPATYVIDVQEISQAITSRTRAIVPVHLYGQAIDFAPLAELARKHRLPVVEDCAQAIGARYGNRAVGSLGDAGCFSFYPTKNLGAFGDGGMVVTSSTAIAERVRSLREYGWKQRSVSSEPGWNSRLDEIQAAILRVLLPHLERENQRRMEIAGLFREKLAGTPLSLPGERDRGSHVYHLFVVRSQDRDSLLAGLRERGIPAQVHYPMPVHLQPGYCNSCHMTALPESESAARQVLSLPLNPHLDDDAACFVAETAARLSS